MYKLFIFACLLAVAVAAPKPQFLYSSSPYAAAYSALAYPAPLASYTAFSSPLVYPSYGAAPVSSYSTYYSVSSSPYTLYYK